MAITELISSLQTNPYFGAGFGLVGLTAGLAIAKKGIVIAWTGFRRVAFVTCEVNSKDRSFYWLLSWISRQTSRSQRVSVQTDFTENEVGRVSCQFGFIPAPGVHFFQFRGYLFRCERVREQMDALAGVPYELVTLTTFGRDNTIFRAMLDEAREVALTDNVGKTCTYLAMGHEWKIFGHPRPRRPLESVILDDGVAETVLNDLNNFINSSQWYHERGIPYRRGYLLYGPPGTGKSSFIFALAGHLNYSICVLNISDPCLTDDRLTYLLNNAPLDAIILLEDIDAAVVSRTEPHPQRYEGLTRVTYSGILNALDGVISSEARVVLMTTNHIEVLDSALTRPGRVDLKVLIDNASDSQLKRAFIRFYPNNSDLADIFISHVRQCHKQISMASIQAHFLQYKGDAKAALKNKIM